MTIYLFYVSTSQPRNNVSTLSHRGLIIHIVVLQVSNSEPAACNTHLTTQVLTPYMTIGKCMVIWSSSTDLLYQAMPRNELVLSKMFPLLGIEPVAYASRVSDCFLSVTEAGCCSLVLTIDGFAFSVGRPKISGLRRSYLGLGTTSSGSCCYFYRPLVPNYQQQ